MPFGARCRHGPGFNENFDERVGNGVVLGSAFGYVPVDDRKDKRAETGNLDLSKARVSFVSRSCCVYRIKMSCGASNAETHCS